MRRYKLPLPEDPQDAGYDKAAHRTAFAAFLQFLKANLAGQTAIRVDPDWATQSKTLEGFAEFALPDVVIREGDIATDIERLALQAGAGDLPDIPPLADDMPFTLADIYDADIEKRARSAYARDYVTFGFGDWSPG